MPVKIRYRGRVWRIGPAAHHVMRTKLPKKAKAAQGAVKERRGATKEIRKRTPERPEAVREMREASSTQQERVEETRSTEEVRIVKKSVRRSAEKARRIETDRAREKYAARRAAAAGGTERGSQSDARQRAARDERDRARSVARDAGEGIDDIVAREEEDDATNRVGYGRPPPERRWKPGQSGNPKGRRKGSRNFKTIIRELAKGKVVVQDADGRRRTMTKLEAVMQVTMNKALKGDPKATAQILTLTREYEADTDASDEARKADPADIALLKNRQALQALLDSVSGDE